MDLSINISTDKGCKVLIADNSQYLPENQSGTVRGEFKYSDTVTIDILQHNKAKETIYRQPTYTLHDTNKEISIPVEFDGWFTVIHLVLPSVEWYKREKEKTEGSAISLYNIVYFTNGKTIYKYSNGIEQEVSLEEVLEINPIDTTISRVEKDYISICFLRKCYINLCQQIFEGRGFSKCFDRTKISSELIYKRDLVWMAINVIKYLTECSQLAEVERLIESINGCNGLCDNSNITSNTNGCGCSK